MPLVTATSLRRSGFSNFTRRFETPQQKKRQELLEEARTRLRDVDRRLATPTGGLSIEEQLKRGLITRRTFEQQLAEREGFRIPTADEPFITPARQGDFIARNILEGLEIAERRAFTPAAALGLQTLESPLGTGIPIVGESKLLQKEVEEVGGIPEKISPLPRTKTFEEVGKPVDIIATLIGDEDEQLRAAKVLEEAGFARALIFRLVFDPLNLLPGVGFTKFRHFTRLLRIASRGGKGAKAAKASLAGHEVVTAARQQVVKEGIETTDRAVAEQAFSTLVQEERALAQRLTPSIAIAKGKTNTLKRILRNIRDGKPSAGADTILRSEIEANLKTAKTTAGEVLKSGNFDVLTVPRLTPEGEAIVTAKELLAQRVEELAVPPSVERLSVDEGGLVTLFRGDTSSTITKLGGKLKADSFLTDDRALAEAYANTKLLPGDVAEVITIKVPKSAVADKGEIYFATKKVSDIVERSPARSIEQLKAAERGVGEGKDLLAGRVRELGGDPAAIEQLSDEALDATTTARAVEPSSIPVESRLDDIAQGADTPKGDPGVTSQIADDAGEFITQTTQTADDVGNTFVGHMRPLDELVPEVVTSDNRVVRWLIGNTGVNSSILDSTEIGKVLQAHYRQRLSGEILAEVAVVGASDVHTSAVLGVGRLSRFAVNPKGFVKNLKVAEGQSTAWWDVFSRPGDYVNLSKSQRAQINDYLKVVKELEEMRVANGLKPRALTDTAEGWFYVPRKAKGVEDIAFNRPSNPGLQRHFEEAREGILSGKVNYETSPRTTLLLHSNQAYREVADAQLATALRPLSVTEKEIMAVLEPKLLSRMETVTTRLVNAEREVRRIRVPRVAKVGKLTKEEKALRTTFNAQRKAAKVELEKARVGFNEVGAQYRRAKEAIREKEILPGKLFGKDQPDKIAVAKWRNRFFPREDVTKLQDGLATMGASISQQNIFAKSFNTLGNTIRMTAALLDFALPFIHGLPTFGRRPDVWARSAKFHYQAWFDPTIQARFLRSHIDTFKRMARSGTPIGDPEFFAALRVGEGLSFDSIAKLIPGGTTAQNAMRLGGRQTAGRFMASYNMGLAANRAFLFEAMEVGWKGTESELWAFIRNMTGGLDTRALGLTPARRGVESMWLAFSPRLLRSTVGLIADLRLGPITPRGRAAWRALGQLSAGATGLYVLSGMALGKDWDEIGAGLNPLNGKRFLSHEVNGQWIGIGGQVRAITQLLAVFGESVITGGAKFAMGDPKGGAAEFTPFASADMMENPLLRVWSGRGAVGLGIAAGTIEATTGADTVPFEDIDGLPELALHIGTSALPFTLQARMEGANWTATAFEVQGFRTSPQTLSEKHDQLFPDTPWREITRAQKAQHIRDEPELQEIRDRLKTEGTAAELIGSILGVDPKDIGIDTQPTNKGDEIRESRSAELIPNAKAVLNKLPGAGEVYNDVRRSSMAKAAGAFEESLGDVDIEFKGRDQILFQQVSQVDFNRDWNNNGIPGDKDDVRIALEFQKSLKAEMSEDAQWAMGNPENFFNDPEVIEVEKVRKLAQASLDIWFDIPRYRTLSMEQSEQVDLLLDRASEIRNLATMAGLRVSRDQVLQVLGALTPGIDISVLVIARASTFSQLKDFVLNPESDQFVLAHPEMLSFYPFLFDTLSVEDQLEARRLELLQAAGVPASYTDVALPPSNFMEAMQPRRELPETFLDEPLLPG